MSDPVGSSRGRSSVPMRTMANQERRMQTIEGHGAHIPVIGLGTMTLKDDACVEIVEAALHLGYRHLDTAQMYGNEREVGAGLRGSGVKREDVFLTTKVWFNRLATSDFERSVDESLERLALPWVDLLMIHWPNAQIPLAESITALCKVKRAGLAKHIGVANFNVDMIDEAVKLANEPLSVLQIEVHPYLDQSKVIAAARRHGIAVVGYCPLARGKVPGDDVLQRIGRAHGKTAAQVALRFLEQQDIIVIPRTSKRARLAENLGSLEFQLSDADMAEIAKLKRADGRLVSPPQAPAWDS
jgi:diketogulonate reductase-like aldo/keto reductase